MADNYSRKHLSTQLRAKRVKPNIWRAVWLRAAVFEAAEGYGMI